jgi:LruC domain-containing protein
LDAYPDDPARTTMETVTGTLAYEDLWPKIGDYDFNDLVIGYTYHVDGNASNEIVSVDLTYKIIASGAGYPDGLALSLPLDTDAYEVSDFSYSKSVEKLEAVVTQYVGSEGSRILIFKTQNDVMRYGSKPNPFNTGDNLELEPQSVSFSITFNTPLSRDVLGPVPYDVFMLIDNAESDTKPDKANREVHLTDYPPTPLANPTFLNTHQDTTDVNEERYYKSANNLPWALHIPGEWEHPLERKSIIDGYNYFGAWAESGGSQYPDWYQAKPNYKNTNNLYRK